jgi:hypothetical protein
MSPVHAALDISNGGVSNTIRNANGSVRPRIRPNSTDLILSKFGIVCLANRSPSLSIHVSDVLGISAGCQMIGIAAARDIA